MSVSTSSLPNELLAKAILLLNNGSLPQELVKALQDLIPNSAAAEPAVAEPATAEPALAEPTAPARKLIRKKKNESKAEPAPVEEESNSLDLKKPMTSVYPNDPYMKHPLRLQTINPAKCMGRRCDNNHQIIGTRTEDETSKGRMFIEKQCTKYPMPGSPLCMKCLERETEYKANPKKIPGEWYGRLDEPLCDYSKVVGSGHFFRSYPNGLPNDPTTAPIASAVVAVPVAPVAAAPDVPSVKTRKPRVVKPKGEKVQEVVAVDQAPKEVLWVSFKHEGRMHIRNVKTGKTYWADMQKHTPDEMAIREHYVGKWVNGCLDLSADSDEDSV